MRVTAPAAGTAHLRFERSGSRTVLTRALAASPVKIFATSPGRAASWVYAATLGGGLLGGDEIDITAELAPGARGLLTTQASTKVYRSSRRARQTFRATLEEDALLVVAPDPVVCFASADYAQLQRYELCQNASLVVVDWITSGRHASGERWAFSRYEGRLAISRDGRPVLRDALVLEADGDSVAERMGRFDVLLTGVITGPLVRSGAEDLLDQMAREPVVENADMIVSASRLSDGGALLRIAAVDVEQVGRTIRRVCRCVCALLGDDPWSRKW